MGCSSECLKSINVASAEPTPLERRLWATLSSQITSRLFTKLEGKLEGRACQAIYVWAHEAFAYSYMITNQEDRERFLKRLDLIRQVILEMPDKDSTWKMDIFTGARSWDISKLFRGPRVLPSASEELPLYNYSE